MSVMHIVLVRWRRETASEAGEAEAASTVAAQANSLTDAHLPGIPGVLEVFRGESVSPEGLEGRFDWGLSIRFADAAARDAYLPHPEHRQVADYLGANAEEIVVFDLDG